MYRKSGFLCVAALTLNKSANNQPFNQEQVDSYKFGIEAYNTYLLGLCYPLL